MTALLERPVTAAVGVPVAGNGIALGTRSFAAIQQTYALVVGSYTWLHEYRGPAPHPEHEQFDGVSFNGDYILEDGINWFPGDHAGSVVAGTLVEGPIPDGAALRHYDGPVVELTTASGKNLTVTPDHPVLTDRGWINAGDLREGDDLIGSTLDQGASALVPDVHQTPALAEDVFGALWLSGRMTPMIVPVASEDFDPEQALSIGEVYVVLANRDLIGKAKAASAEPNVQQLLAGASRLGETLTCSSAALKRVQTIGPTSFGVMRCGDNLLATLFATEKIDDDLLFPWGSFVDPTLPEDSINSPSGDPVEVGHGIHAVPGDVGVHDVQLGHDCLIPGSAPLGVLAADVSDGVETLRDSGVTDAEMGSDFADRHPGLVERDKLVDVKGYSWSGHMYDFQTRGSWYIANGIIVHNCACGSIPEFVEVVQ